MAHHGFLHQYTKRLVAFEHRSPDLQAPKHTLLWIGGLGDGLLTTPYTIVLSQKLPAGWALAQVLLSSSYDGWGAGSLSRDSRELAQCVSYFHRLRPGGKLVIMGHSTGCQDAMEYLVGAGCKDRPRVQGCVLQASVSDREGLVDSLLEEVYLSGVKAAKQLIEEGRGQDALPRSISDKPFGGFVSAERYLSLASPNKDGNDDYFSSDLDDRTFKRTFGAIPSTCPLLLLYSGDDEYVPKHVDKHALVAKWTKFVKDAGGFVDEENGGIVVGAHHNLQDDSPAVVGDLVRRVNAYLTKVDHDDFG